MELEFLSDKLRLEGLLIMGKRIYPCYCCGMELTDKSHGVWTYNGGCAKDGRIVRWEYRPDGKKKSYRFGQQEVTCHSCDQKYLQHRQREDLWEYWYVQPDGEIEVLY